MSATQTFNGSITGNAETVTTNANLTGDVTSSGNATTIKEAPVIKALTLNPGTQLQTSWNNYAGMYETWASSGANITSAKNTSSAAYANGNILNLVVGKVYIVTINLTINSGDAPTLETANITPTITGDIPTTTLIEGVNKIVFKAANSAIGLWIGNTTNCDWSATFTVTELPLTVNNDIYLNGNMRVVIPTYPNNAAAIAGGLVAGQFYRVNAATDPEPLYIVH